MKQGIHKKTEEYFARVTEYLNKNAGKKRELADYLTEHLGEGRKPFRTGEISRWLTSKERSEFTWTVGNLIIKWYVNEPKELKQK